MFFKNKNVTQSYLTKLIAVAFYPACFFMFIFYYIDVIIILEYTPFVKFIGNYIRDSSDVIFHILTGEDIDDSTDVKFVS